MGKSFAETHHSSTSPGTPATVLGLGGLGASPECTGVIEDGTSEALRHDAFGISTGSGGAVGSNSGDRNPSFATHSGVIGESADGIAIAGGIGHMRDACASSLGIGGGVSFAAEDTRGFGVVGVSGSGGRGGGDGVGGATDRRRVQLESHVVHQQYYYLGMIDILQTWTLKKRCKPHMMAALEHTSDHLTTIPPHLNPPITLLPAAARQVGAMVQSVPTRQ